MQTSLTLDPSKAFRAFDDYARMQEIRGKNGEQILRKLMKFWISFALFKIEAASPQVIGDSLMKLTTAYSRVQIRSRRSGKANSKNRYGPGADKYRGTVAAAIVAILNYKGAKSLIKKGDGTAFYNLVGKFVGARKYSAKLHKAGFYPAIKSLKLTGQETRLPRYRHTPGTYTEAVRERAATLIAENFASSAQRPGRPAPLGIAGIAPNCLSDSEPQLAKLLEDWLMKDLMDAAHGAGFSTYAAGPVTSKAA